MRIRMLIRSCALICISGFILWKCSIIIDSDEFDPQWNERRMYVNDEAPNDSLNSSILTGVNFFLQPGGNYTLKIKGGLPQKSRFHVYKLYRNWYERWGEPVPATGSGNNWTFKFESDFDVPSFFWAVLDHPALTDGKTVEDAHFSGSGPYPQGVFGVNYHFIGDYSKYRQSQLNGLSERLHSGLNEIYQSSTGIDIKYGGSVIHGGINKIQLNFPMDYQDMPKISGGPKGYINMVFVESIKTSEKNLVILGFAPREASAINYEPENVVILSLALEESRIINTMAHELGHFLGLRHTVATQQDIDSEKDGSNIEDGFTDTEFCRLNSSILSTLSKPQKTGYCIRIAGPSVLNGQCSKTARKNLMYPLEDRTLIQNQLSSQQIKFIQKNLSLMQR